MLFLNQRTKLKEDAIIGLIFTSFLRAWTVHGLGVAHLCRHPDDRARATSSAVTPADTLQLVVIAVVSLTILLAKWKDLLRGLFASPTRAPSG
jgi:manganese/iron transport system permease protein